MKILPPASEIISGVRLDVYLAENTGLSRSASKRKIENGEVSVNGKIQLKSYILKGNDVVSFVEDEPASDIAIPQNIPIDIIYEDDCLLVVNKERGMVVHPAAGNADGTLVNSLLYHCGGNLSGVNGLERPGIVHRIDKDTSGLLVAAKNDFAHVFLAEQIKSHTFERRYEAVICGRLKQEKGKIDLPISRCPKNRKKMAVVEGGRNAVTHYEVIAEYSGYSHISLRLETGRTHQIRVHMSHIGHPVAGDALYGANDKIKGLKGQCLHARTISFLHPMSGEIMRFDTELPEYFIKVLEEISKIQ